MLAIERCLLTRKRRTFTHEFKQEATRLVLDLYARHVVGWAMSDTAVANLVAQALAYTWEQRGRPQGVMFPSDQGAQCVSRKFPQKLWRYRRLQSMSH